MKNHSDRDQATVRRKSVALRNQSNNVNRNPENSVSAMKIRRHSESSVMGDTGTGSFQCPPSMSIALPRTPPSATYPCQGSDYFIFDDVFTELVDANSTNSTSVSHPSSRSVQSIQASGGIQSLFTSNCMQAKSNPEDDNSNNLLGSQMHDDTGHTSNNSMNFNELSNCIVTIESNQISNPIAIEVASPRSNRDSNHPHDRDCDQDLFQSQHTSSYDTADNFTNQPTERLSINQDQEEEEFVSFEYVKKLLAEDNDAAMDYLDDVQLESNFDMNYLNGII